MDGYPLRLCNDFKGTCGAKNNIEAHQEYDNQVANIDKDIVDDNDTLKMTVEMLTRGCRGEETCTRGVSGAQNQYIEVLYCLDIAH